MFLSATAHSHDYKALGTEFQSEVHRLLALPMRWLEALRSTGGCQTLLIYPRLRWPDGMMAFSVAIWLKACRLKALSNNLLS